MADCKCTRTLTSGDPRHVLEVSVANFKCAGMCEAKRQCLIDWIEKDS